MTTFTWSFLLSGLPGGFVFSLSVVANLSCSREPPAVPSWFLFQPETLESAPPRCFQDAVFVSLHRFHRAFARDRKTSQDLYSSSPPESRPRGFLSLLCLRPRPGSSRWLPRAQGKRSPHFLRLFSPFWAVSFLVSGAAAPRRLGRAAGPPSWPPSWRRGARPGHGHAAGEPARFAVHK